MSRYVKADMIGCPYRVGRWLRRMGRFGSIYRIGKDARVG